MYSPARGRPQEWSAEWRSREAPNAQLPTSELPHDATAAPATNGYVRLSTPSPISVPRAGMLATVRNRRGVVAAVEPSDGETGRLHLVHLEYKDDHAPSEERILWEIEPNRHLLEPNALPAPTHAGGAMPAEDFDALLRAARWTALSPYLDPERPAAPGAGREPLSRWGVRRELPARPAPQGAANAAREPAHRR